MTVTDDRIAAWLHGGLNGEEAARIEALAANDPKIAARAAELRRLDDLFRQAVPLEEPLPEALMARLGLSVTAAGTGNVVDLAEARAARIEQAPARPSRFAAPFRFAMLARGGWRIAAQVLIVVGIGVSAVTLIGLPGREEPEANYRALGDAPSAEMQANVLVMFDAGTGAAQAREIATRAGARIVGDPTAAGAWRLVVDPSRRGAVLDRLRGMPEVSMAEPIDGASR